jgi:hypothetical protein
MYKSFIFGFLRPYHSKNEKYVKREICWSNLLVINFFFVFQLSNLVIVRFQLSLCSVSVYSSWFRDPSDPCNLCILFQSEA